MPRLYWSNLYLGASLATTPHDQTKRKMAVKQGKEKKKTDQHRYIQGKLVLNGYISQPIKTN